MSSSNANNDHDDPIEQFCNITGADRSAGKHMMEACNGNISAAVEMFLESGCRSAFTNPPAEVSNDSSASSSFGVGEIDRVRAPIPQKMEKLVDRQPEYNYSRKRRHNVVFDAFRDFQSETDSLDLPQSGSSTRSLQQLFRPPLELLFRGPFDAAKSEGQLKDKWLLVNVQNTQEFASLALNRDVWSNREVKELVKEHFVLWQVYSDTYHGSKYMQFYKVIDWPHVSFLDPRTGEKLLETNTLDPQVFCMLVREFIEEQGSPMKSGRPPANKKPRMNQEDTILEASEEAQLRMAMLASMKEGRKKRSSEEDDNEVAEVEGDDDEIVISDVDTISLLTFSEEEVSSDTKRSKGKATKSNNSNNVTIPDKSKASTSKNNFSKSKNNFATSKNNFSKSKNKCLKRAPDNDSSLEACMGKSEDYSNLVLRMPDGKRHVVSWPHDSHVTILPAFVSELGYDVSQLEFVTCYPKRVIDVTGGDGGGGGRGGNDGSGGRSSSNGGNGETGETGESCGNGGNSNGDCGAVALKQNGGCRAVMNDDSGMASSGSSGRAAAVASSNSSNSICSSSSCSNSSTADGGSSGCNEDGDGGSNGGGGGEVVTLKQAGLHPKETIFVQML